MAWDLLLLVLLGGYFFSRLDPRTAHSANRLRRDRLLFQAAGLGFLFAAISFALVHLVLVPFVPSLATAWKEWFPQHFSGTAAGALLLGLCFGAIFRLLCLQDEVWCPRHPRVARCYRSLRAKLPNLAVRWDSFRGGFRDAWLKAYLRRWVEDQGSNLEKLLFRLGDEGTPVQVTLDNRKVYIGEVDYFPAELEETGTHLELILYASGYRTENTLSLCVTNRYARLIMEIETRLERLNQWNNRYEQRKTKEWANRDFCDYRRQRIAERYVDLYEELVNLRKQLVVTVPFHRITTAMPFYEPIYRRMDGQETAQSST